MYQRPEDSPAPSVYSFIINGSIRGLVTVEPPPVFELCSISVRFASTKFLLAKHQLLFDMFEMKQEQTGTGTALLRGGLWFAPTLALDRFLHLLDQLLQ
jgi:hypothetical protein